MNYVEHDPPLITPEWLASASAANSMALGDPVYDWQSLAVQYANALAAANARIIELERDCAKWEAHCDDIVDTQIAECEGPQAGDILARTASADRLPDSYAR